MAVVTTPGTPICGGPTAPGAMARVVSVATESPDTGLFMSPLTRLTPARNVLTKEGPKIWVSSALAIWRREKTWWIAFFNRSGWDCGPESQKYLAARLSFAEILLSTLPVK